MTAVQWLEIVIQNKLTSEMGPYFKEAFEQAKEMEKEQIVEAYDAGLFDGTMDDVNDRIHKQYYNETFKPKQR